MTDAELDRLVASNWKCDGCGEYVDYDESLGHEVDRGYGEMCGPIALDGPRLARAAYEAGQKDRLAKYQDDIGFAMREGRLQALKMVKRESIVSFSVSNDETAWRSFPVTWLESEIAKLEKADE